MKTDQEEFEQWVGSEFLTSKRDNPACWRGSVEDIEEWKRNPYDNPYTRGAYDCWNYLQKLQEK